MAQLEEFPLLVTNTKDTLEDDWDRVRANVAENNPQSVIDLACVETSYVALNDPFYYWVSAGLYEAGAGSLTTHRDKKIYDIMPSSRGVMMFENPPVSADQSIVAVAWSRIDEGIGISSLAERGDGLSLMPCAYAAYDKSATLGDIADYVDENQSPSCVYGSHDGLLPVLAMMSRADRVPGFNRGKIVDSWQQVLTVCRHVFGPVSVEGEFVEGAVIEKWDL